MKKVLAVFAAAAFCSMPLSAFASAPAGLGSLETGTPGLSASGGASVNSISNMLMKQVTVQLYSSRTGNRDSDKRFTVSGSTSIMNIELPQKMRDLVYDKSLDRYEVTVVFSVEGAKLTKYAVSVDSNLLKTTYITASPNGGTFTATVDAPASISTIPYNVTVSDATAGTAMVWGQISYS